LSAADALYGKARAAIDRQGLRLYLDAVWAVVADANRYFAAEAPWAKRDSDPVRMATVLYVTAEVVRQIAILVAPVMPTAADRLLDQLGQTPEARVFEALGKTGRLQPGTPLPPPVGVFPRYVAAALGAQVDAGPTPQSRGARDAR
jgi:methionyl-tRNA synthetase